MTRRKKWWIAGVFVLSAIVAGGIGLSRRQTSAFPDLYRLADAVGQGRASYVSPYVYLVHRPRARAPVTMHTGSLKPMTVLVFDRNDKHAVETAMSRYFPGTGGTFLWMVTASGTSRASRATIGTVSYTSDEKYSASLITGSMAEVVSKDAGLRLPKDGFVVTLSEAPDWWAAKLKGFLKACGLG